MNQKSTAVKPERSYLLDSVIRKALNYKRRFHPLKLSTTHRYIHTWAHLCASGKALHCATILQYVLHITMICLRRGEVSRSSWRCNRWVLQAPQTCLTNVLFASTLANWTVHLSYRRVEIYRDPVTYAARI